MSRTVLLRWLFSGTTQNRFTLQRKKQQQQQQQLQQEDAFQQDVLCYFINKSEQSQNQS